MTIGKNIQRFRHKKNLSQTQLVKSSGIKLTTLVKLEGGSKSNPTMKTLIKLADALDVTLDELVGREPNSVGKK
ncbi:MAG: helix-turn-helix transcriptional regulator [Bacteroidetes bacterium]|nr:helix-turn-helix transcriptional regulator [Bacteroidota bacterium]